jgi:intraflagellar transport protein 46
MKPTIIEDSESDEDAIVSAKDNEENIQTMKMLEDPLLAGNNRNNQAQDLHGNTDHEDDEDDDEDDDDDVAAPPPEGMYDPSEFDHLNVSAEIKELFSDILRYTPQAIELETRFKPFIPEFIPAVGDIDAFIKVSRPDSNSEIVGLSVLDEPAARQSDPSVLDLQLRAISKHSTQKEAVIKKIDNSEKSAKAIEKWINDISDLHRSKPPPSVHYTKPMPDIDNLMQEWPPQVEETLKESGLPTADFDCDTTTYVDIICSLLDIPIHKSRIQSLHVLFSLYSAFKHSQHFNQLALENNMDNMAFDDETGQML